MRKEERGKREERDILLDPFEQTSFSQLFPLSPFLFPRSSKKIFG